MEFIKTHIVDILIVIALIIIVAFAIRRMVIKKGKCAYCSHADTCPFKYDESKRSA